MNRDSYRYFVLAAPRAVECRERSATALQAGWVRVRFVYCGVCGSDMSQFAGLRDLDYPVSIGHEFVGEVVEVGPDVSDFAPDDIVTSDLNYRCGECRQCQARRSHLCERGQVGLFTNRAFAELADLDARYLVRVEAPRMCFALTEPLSCVLHARDWAAPSPTERVLVLGAGGIGMCMAFALCNHSPPIPFDITDRLPDRLASIAAAISPAGHAVTRLEGTYDVVFDLSGTESGLQRACDVVGPGGRLCSMSHIDGAVAGPYLLRVLTRRDVTFTVSYLNGERETIRRAGDLLASGWNESWEKLVEVRPLAELQQAFDDRPTSPWCKTMIAVS